MSLPPSVTICEVGLRDGLQHEETILPTSLKLDLIRRLVDAGLKALSVDSGMPVVAQEGAQYLGASDEHGASISTRSKRSGVLLPTDRPSFR